MVSVPNPRLKASQHWVKTRDGKINKVPQAPPCLESTQRRPVNNRVVSARVGQGPPSWVPQWRQARLFGLCPCLLRHLPPFLTPRHAHPHPTPSNSSPRPHQVRPFDSTDSGNNSRLIASLHLHLVPVSIHTPALSDNLPKWLRG